MKAVRLKTAYLHNPVGIDLPQPKFSWNLSGEGQRQTGYEIRAAHSEEDLTAGRYVWESGVVESDSMLHNPYGRCLASRERIFWQVRIRDEIGNMGPWSEVAAFEMGLLRKEDWTAQWISGNYESKREVRYPADYFRRKFDVEHAKHARLYITACGVYEAMLNGRHVGIQILTPGFTSYDKRVQYQTYDVSDYLEEGENILEIVLADGWFRGCLGAEQQSCVYGSQTAVLAQLEWEDVQGKRHTLVTDDSFEWCNDGPVRFADLMCGERIDASRLPSYTGCAKVIQWDVRVSAPNNVPVTEHEHFKPMVIHTPDGSIVLDFGQNIAGYVAFEIEAEAGREVCLTMGEKLDKQGNFTLDNILQEITFQEDTRDFSEFQKISYVCRGGKKEYYKPKFCIQGFRYVLLSNWPYEPKPEDFTAIAVYSDMEQCMEFFSSSDDCNKIVNNTFWSMKGNFLDVPTDCPTRERSAWSGDAQLFFNAGCYFMDVSAFFRKWIQDMFDDQASDGKIYNIVPRSGVHGGPNEYVEGSAGWTDAGILIPYRYWKQYGDVDILKQYYGQMKRLADFLLSRRGVEDVPAIPGAPSLDEKLPPSEYRKYMVTTGFHFGEWTEPDIDVVEAMMDTSEEATAYLIYSLRCMAEIAEVTGHCEDSAMYTQYADESQAAYLHYHLPDDTVSSRRMCKYVRPLALGLLEGNSKAKRNVQQGLTALAEQRKYHVGTGFLSTPFLLDELTRAGSVDDAYKTLLNEEYPGWVHEIREGATTVWENWDDDASLNHYSKGAVCEWIFRTVCGIRIEKENRFCIAPLPGGGLSFAGGTYMSPYGAVSCEWHRTKKEVQYQISIPVGCSARIELPDGSIHEAVSGIYCFCQKENK